MNIQNKICVLLLAILILTTIISYADNGIIASCNAVLASKHSEIVRLAKEHSSEEYDIKGFITLGFDVAADGTATPRILGSTIIEPRFTEAVMTSAKTWEFPAYTLAEDEEAEVFVFKQYSIPIPSFIIKDKIVVSNPIVGQPGAAGGAKSIFSELMRTKKTMEYRYTSILKKSTVEELPGRGGDGLLFVYTDLDGFILRVSTRYFPVKDLKFRAEIEGWLKACSFPTDAPKDAVVVFPLSFRPKTGEATSAGVGDYQKCLLGYKDIVRERYEWYLGETESTGGEIKALISISSGGKVSVVEIIESTLNDDGFMEMFPEIVAEWVMPGGEGTEIEFTFKL